jgi:meiotic recombination protein SPO11
MSTFKSSSPTLRHESQNLTCPTLQWLGLKTSQLRINAQYDGHCLLRLTARDRRHATLMLKRRPLMLERPVSQEEARGIEEGAELEWRRELQLMLMLNKKAEIQFLESSESGLAGWLKNLGF